jgi:hypothetical protein
MILIFPPTSTEVYFEPNFRGLALPSPASSSESVNSLFPHEAALISPSRFQSSITNLYSQSSFSVTPAAECIYYPTHLLNGGAKEVPFISSTFLEVHEEAQIFTKVMT